MSERVRLIRSDTNRGAAAARSTGARVTTAPFLAFVDQDDIVTDRHFSVARSLHNRADMVISSGWRWSSSELSPLYAKKQRNLTFAHLHKICWIMSPGQVTLKATTYFSLGGFDPTCEWGVDDYDLWLRLFRADVTRTWSGEPTYIWRKHEANWSSSLPMGASARSVRERHKRSGQGRRDVKGHVPGRTLLADYMRRGQTRPASSLVWSSMGWRVQ